MFIRQSIAELSQFEPSSVTLIACTVAGMSALRYVVFAGGALLLVRYFSKALAPRRIQPFPFTAGQLCRESAYSALSILVFTLVFVCAFTLNGRLHVMRIYRDFGVFGTPWFFLSIPVAILIHDFYFYWTHRFMHLPGVFERIHKVHHLSINPSPLAAFAFHPLEALVESGALIVVTLIIPIHPAALVMVGLYSILTNVMGHLGYELLPHNVAAHPIFGWLNTATSHNQHHRTFTRNFGLYTLIWDRLFGTLHPLYEELFERTTGRRAPTLREPSSP